MRFPIDKLEKTIFTWAKYISTKKVAIDFTLNIIRLIKTIHCKQLSNFDIVFCFSIQFIQFFHEN